MDEEKELVKKDDVDSGTTIGSVTMDDSAPDQTGEVGSDTSEKDDGEADTSDQAGPGPVVANEKVEQARENFFRNINAVKKDQFRTKYESAKTAYETSIQDYLNERKKEPVDTDSFQKEKKEYEKAKKEWNTVKRLARFGEKVKGVMGSIKDEKKLEAAIFYEETNVYLTVNPHLRRILHRYKRITESYEAIEKKEGEMNTNNQEINTIVDTNDLEKRRRRGIDIAFEASILLDKARTAKTDIDVATRTITDFTYFKLVTINEELKKNGFFNLKKSDGEKLFGDEDGTNPINLIYAISVLKEESKIIIEQIETIQQKIDDQHTELCKRALAIVGINMGKGLEQLGLGIVEIGTLIIQGRLKYIDEQFALICENVDREELANVNIDDTLNDDFINSHTGLLNSVYKKHETIQGYKTKFDGFIKGYGWDYSAFKISEYYRDDGYTQFKNNLKEANDIERDTIAISFNAMVEGKSIERAYVNIKHANIAIQTAIATYSEKTKDGIPEIKIAENYFKLAEQANEKAKTLFNFRSDTGTQAVNAEITAYVNRLRSFQLAHMIETTGFAVVLSNYLWGVEREGALGISIIAIEALIILIGTPVAGVFGSLKAIAMSLSELRNGYLDKISKAKEKSKTIEEKLKEIAKEIIKTEDEYEKEQQGSYNKNQLATSLNDLYLRYDGKLSELEEEYKKAYYYNSWKGKFKKLGEFVGQIGSVDIFYPFNQSLKVITAISDQVKTGVVEAVDYTGKKIVEDRKREIERQLASANRSAAIAESKSNKLTRDVDGVKLDVIEPGEITQEIEKAVKIPTLKLVSEATNAATTADIAQRDVYYAVNFLNKIAEDKKMKIEEKIFVQDGNGAPPPNVIELNAQVEDKYTLIAHAEDASKRASNAAKTARQKAVEIVNKTRKLRFKAVSKFGSNALKRLKTSTNEKLEKLEREAGKLRTKASTTVGTAVTGLGTAATNIGATAVDLGSSLKASTTEKLGKLEREAKKLRTRASDNVGEAVTGLGKAAKGLGENAVSLGKTAATNIGRAAITSTAAAKTAYKSLVPLTDTKVLKETYTELGRLKDELERIRNIVDDKGFKGLDYLPDGTLGNTNDYIKVDDSTNDRKTSLYEYFSKKFPFTYLKYTDDVDTNVNNYKKSDDPVIQALISKSKTYLPTDAKNGDAFTDEIQGAIDTTNTALKAENDEKNKAEAKAITSIGTGGMVGGESGKDRLLELLKKQIDIIDELMKKIAEKVTPDKKKLAALNGPEKAAEGISDPEFKVVSRVFPAPFVNSKGFRIGNYHVIVNTDKLPFRSTDEADHFLYNLFDYINYEGTPKTSRKMARKIKDFFKHKEVDLTAFLPIKYPDPFQEEFLRQQQVILMEENKKLRRNLRKLRNELAGFSYDEADTKLREAALKTIEDDVGIKKIVDKKDSTDQGAKDKARAKEEASKKLAAYIDAIDEEEGLLEGEAPEYKPALLQERAKGAATVVGGSKKKRVQRKNRRTKRRKQGK
jgi:hypothetical protein